MIDVRSVAARMLAWLTEAWYRFLEAFAPRWLALGHWIDSRFGDEELTRDDAVA